jgi:hypothetical protein
MWREDENKKSNINKIAQKKGGPRRRPTKLEAAAINFVLLIVTHVHAIQYQEAV